jgi:7-cyano-7-deazaguanine synthase
MLSNHKVLVVLSGGQDSTICLFLAKQFFPEVSAITVDYGQRHKIEIESARKVAAMAGVASHRILELGPVLGGMSPLTNSSEPVEQYESFEQMEKIIGSRIEKTFVPMRNPLFLVLAVNAAVVLGISDIFTGVCEADGANYCDCRGRFIKSFEVMTGLALEQDIRIRAPLLYASKAESIKIAQQLPGCMDALAYSHTDYEGLYPPGNNHASVLRAHGFEEAGVADPLILRAWREGLLAELPGTGNYDASRASAPASVN